MVFHRLLVEKRVTKAWRKYMQIMKTIVSMIIVYHILYVYNKNNSIYFMVSMIFVFCSTEKLRRWHKGRGEVSYINPC